ncbi:hypothetical protein ACQV2S_00945 [Facklamia sp. P13064]|uniref:SMODS-associated NUDIX domain-containing protein n=1 Tax=Facklamia sp. P13064 TaxID=3421953 RepID=UPI003D1665C3
MGTYGRIKKRVKIFTQSLLRKNKTIRISCAYLFRIKFENKYLLIKGNQIDQYQPVGGVNKYYESFQPLKNTMEITDEKEVNFYEDRDLRIYTKGKYIPGYLNWFASKKNHEVTVHREFLEELGSFNEFNGELLSKTRIEFIKQIEEPITYSKHFKCDEIKIFEIFELGIPMKQLEEISNRKNIVLVGEEEIERECTNLDGKSRKIAVTAKYVL